MRIAVLDDEEICLDRALKVIRSYSRASGFDWKVHGFSSGEDLLRSLKRENFDLLIIDWYLPGMSGDALLCWVQEHLEVPPPVIVLTGGSSGGDIVKAINAGAEDFIHKPFSEHELHARILVVNRRRIQAAEEQVQRFHVYFDLLFDDAGRTVTRDCSTTLLTEREYYVARCLMENLGRSLSRSYLYDRFWPQGERYSSRPLDTMIYRLRSKLKLSSEYGWCLASIYGYGYRLERVDPL